MFAAISAFSTAYFTSFLAKLAGVVYPFHLIVGGAIGLGLTVAYISKEFDNTIEKLGTGKKKISLRFTENKFIYFVRFTTVMGTCMLLYSGIELNQRQLEGQQRAVMLFETELTRKRDQENFLLNRNIVSATDTTITQQNLSQSTDHTAFLKYLAQLTPFSYTLFVLLFIASMGLGIDFGVSILTQKCAKLSYMALKSFYRKRKILPKKSKSVKIPEKKLSRFSSNSDAA